MSDEVQKLIWGLEELEETAKLRLQSFIGPVREIKLLCYDVMEKTEEEDRLLKLECLRDHMSGIIGAIISSIKLLGELNEDE